VLAQARVDGKANEITQLALLLKPLDLTGCMITADGAARVGAPAILGITTS
jgi:hypothetical protein